MHFREALTQVYQAAPCQVLPNPLWKTLAALPGCQSNLIQDSQGKPAHLEIWRDTQLLLYWDTDRVHLKLSPAQIEQITFALIHQDHLSALQPQRFSRRTAYFRLETCFASPLPQPALTPGYGFRPVQVERETIAVADLIRRCYANLAPSAETVSSWAKHPVFSPDLWVWVWDEEHALPAGLGIAEIDPSAAEGALEWIQILPEYQGRGLGSALVNELLRRIQPRVPLVTVSGEVENALHPEKLYRRCGFTGQDVWWVLQTRLQ